MSLDPRRIMRKNATNGQPLLWSDELHGWSPGNVGSLGTLSSDVKMGTAGNGLYVKEGANATMGAVVLVLGNATVSTNKVTANSRIFLGNQALGTITAPVALAVTGRTPGTSFSIGSANLTDTSTIAWMIVEPA